MQEKVGEKENEEKENREERKEERNCFLLLCLVGEKSEKKENMRENIFFLFGWIEKWEERKINVLKWQKCPYTAKAKWSIITAKESTK